MHYRSANPANPYDGGVCKCGAPQGVHEWRCDECGTLAARIGTCGCGAVHMPEPGCDCKRSMSLYCPADRRTIDDEEWAEHERAQATYKELRDKLGPDAWHEGRFRVAEAERLRGASA